MEEFLKVHKDHLQETLILGLLFISIYFLLKFFFKKFKKGKLSIKFIARTKLLLATIFILFLFLIWIPGFWRLLTVLGFVAGAIILTQKFNIQNLVGYLIISWREIFEIGDIIQLSNRIGKVTSVGPLYITLQEITLEPYLVLTGNIIKIPNGHVSNHTIINYSEKKAHKIILTYVFDKHSKTSNLDSFLQKVTSHLKEELKKQRYAQNHLDVIETSISYSIKQTTPVGINVNITISAHFDLLVDIKKIVDEYIIELDRSDKNIKLSF